MGREGWMHHHSDEEEDDGRRGMIPPTLTKHRPPTTIILTSNLRNLYGEVASLAVDRSFSWSVPLSDADLTKVD
jgi:hypothetical protein